MRVTTCVSTGGAGMVMNGLRAFVRDQHDRDTCERFKDRVTRSRTEDDPDEEFLAIYGVISDRDSIDDRQLCALDMGLVRGVENHYGSRLEIEEHQCTKEGADVCRMEVGRASRRARPDRPTGR